MAREPRIHPEFPVDGEEQLSPPIVSSPIYECAEAVNVYGFVPHATVEVFANGNDLVGSETPPFGFAQINLTRRLNLGESITATQTVNGVTSVQSYIPVIVSPRPDQLGKPVVNPDIYECGRVVPVSNLSPSVRVHVSENGAVIGSKPTDGTWEDVVTQPLNAGGSVTAQQVACEGDAAQEVKSPVSEPVIVQGAPNPMPAPKVDAKSLYVGNDTVTCLDLLIGSAITILDSGNVVSNGWLANGPANVFPIDNEITANSVISATQELCGNVSPESDPADPEGELRAPIVLEPICEGSQFAVIRDTVINANVVLFVNGAVAGYGGAVNGDLIIAFGAGVQVSAGDTVTAIQTMGMTLSPMSNSVTVVGQLEAPVVEILGGEPFFIADSTEKQIDGPVFPRGRGAGPLIRVQACCSEDVKVTILNADGDMVWEPSVTELFPGYFSATWNWQSQHGWSVPGGIPAGKYSAVVSTGCNQEEVSATFYIIFDPAEVNGAPRFSFNETNVWFGTGQNSTRALLYHLHPDDARVFSVAINAAQGHSDPAQAAIAISNAEEQLFSYSLNYHTDDVIVMLEKYTEAQCADDSNCLVAFLRAVGIPAHTVTADAALETGDAGWTFDTWVEYIVAIGGNPQPRILHPHQYPNDPPMTRSDFGANKSVATNKENDIIVMAGVNWVWSEAGDGSSDVTYGRNNCNEPTQALNAKPWIVELCEQGYWQPPHWDCTGVSSHTMSASYGLRLYEERPGFGEMITGEITIVNNGEERTHVTLGIDLVSDRLESKRFPEEVYDETYRRILIAPGEEVTVPFELQMPSTLAPGHSLYVRAHVDERIVALAELPAPRTVESALDMPTDLNLGDEFEIVAVVTNMSDRSLYGLSVDLELPYALYVRDQGPQVVEELVPGDALQLNWRARAVAPLEAGTVRLSVSAAEGGSSLTLMNVRVVDSSAVSDAPPAIRPEQ
ncbi:MAG: transglutaminase domain-containing protein [Candidatus Promineifilaceae bacterium]